ncbi:hypothetical protein PVAP13_3KG421100 [Panicum virgatum]|uniref:Uncharacterized protein n=1 Tax=Panicum virgatum TaxID=38727 RepID=A0A8T0V406_PANVG|nr:hypothetical protein PVAP13_3KG421100 [Panicum virgatum]
MSGIVSYTPRVGRHRHHDVGGLGIKPVAAPGVNLVNLELLHPSSAMCLSPPSSITRRSTYRWQSTTTAPSRLAFIILLPTVGTSSSASSQSVARPSVQPMGDPRIRTAFCGQSEWR